MPFSMEVDQTFIAAILTVIGYSINDTVVVFDRIRETIQNYLKRDRYQVSPIRGTGVFRKVLAQDEDRPSVPSFLDQVPRGDPCILSGGLGCRRLD